MKKRVFKIGAVALVSAFALSACGGTTESPSNEGSNGSAPAAVDPANLETEISILAPSYADSSKSDWDAIIAKFNETYPKVKVNLQIEGWDGFAEKISARIQAGDYPDILNDNAFAASADAGLLYPIDEVVSADTIAAIEPSLLANGVGADGTQWAAPDIASARMLIYNTDLFEKAGIAAAPKSWAEMEDAATKLVALGDGTVGYGMPLGSEEAQVESSLWLWGAGGTWVDGENLVADTPEAVEAFTEMKKLHSEGLTQPKLEDNRQDVANLMHAGKLGMIVGHSQIVADAEAQGINVALAPVPDKAGGDGVTTGVTDFIVAFNNEDADRKAATGALLDLMYSDAMYEGWYKGTKLLPVTTSMIEKAKADATTDNEKGFLEALSIVKFLPVGNTQWDALQTSLQGNAYRVGTDDPAALLKEIQAQVDAQS
ncbi:multiple sugar transport system substrate-binding protein [Tessaracoccus bendigoensis DSM 12906]|uniref:Multiple sugar transport system substrate-binding protein n=1 Tax=Tessaracoccus bendigoensis DSM 12906 TaxID=1123357 RepID=A0A1M6CXW1_9ACTN|nr:sugar ABC transporter substrate-binding protein [Tessaracoccus bendigoensis]SHI65915.1 multiple sugar transport system substrate-binding protein [Tessaracoccus bendigoensis DSM 12906]